MKTEQQRKIAAAFQKCKLKAISEINTCFHPECTEKSINSHILQKNGILSTLEKDGHVMEMGIDPFKSDIHYFNRIGIKKAYSFKCFCNPHDTDLFKSIESDEINFAEYSNLILFTLRTIYNEKFRKLVNVRMRELLIKEHSDLYDVDFLSEQNNQEKLGLSDIEKVEKVLLEVVKPFSKYKMNYAPSVQLRNYGNSSVDFRVFFFSENILYIDKVLSDIRKDIFTKFREENIEFPFPQMDVWLKNKDKPAQ